MGKGKDFITYFPADFITYFLAVDESTDTPDIAQLSTLVRVVASSLRKTEEFLALYHMYGTTTGQDLYEELSRCVNEMGLPWETDGAPTMCGHRSGLVERMREENVTGELTAYYITDKELFCGKTLKMDNVMRTITRPVDIIRAKGLNHCHFKAFLGELDPEYGDLLYHTEVRWLCQGEVLQRCFELREEVRLFMESKGKHTEQSSEMKHSCVKWHFLCVTSRAV